MINPIISARTRMTQGGGGGGDTTCAVSMRACAHAEFAEAAAKS
jgi:hypothetical protein